jgi:putative protein-disulfide isomerase
MTVRPRILVVTDPMCSWCWGMSGEVELAAARLVGSVDFDLLLGGVNTHASQPIGQFGRNHLMEIWRDVQATTGQAFGFRLPDVLIYNSTGPCLAVEAVRDCVGAPPFGYLHRLQQQFFVEGLDVGMHALQRSTAVEFGIAADMFDERVESARVRGLVEFQFTTSRSFGTNALPALLWEQGGERSLLAGGYADAEMICELARQHLANR